MENREDAYKEGYAQGKADGLVDHVGHAIFDSFRDDPGGWRATGYADGAAGKTFRPRGRGNSKSKPIQARESSASPLEKQWYGLCNSSEFIPEFLVSQFIGALNAAGHQVAVVVGLSDFTSHVCPKCGRKGQFKIHFLGRIGHPGDCDWKGYMKTGSYIGFQFAQIFHSGIRAGGSVKDEADRKGESGGWLQGILIFLLAGMFRALMSLVLIPLHIIVALSVGRSSKPASKSASAGA